MAQCALLRESMGQCALLRENTSELKGLDQSVDILSSFYKRDNFCDTLFAFGYTMALCKGFYSIRK